MRTAMIRRMTFVVPAICVGMLIASVPFAARATDANEALATDLAVLFRSARKVISDNQALINDAGKADKGLSGEAVVAEAKKNYKAATGNELATDAEGVEGQLKQAMITSIDQVMKNAQPLINREGMGFKGFLPAVFAKQVADAFTKNATGTAAIKLTAPQDYVRNRANAPDEWEAHVIEELFRKPDYPKGKAFAEVGQHGGQSAYRLIIPEYYGESCLGCHGEPKGTPDITGGKKEGGKLGELGGAISVSIYGDAAAAGN